MRKIKPTTTDRPGKIGVNYMTYSTFRREFEGVKE